MAHLIQMRQRIKAIETIKKITHAMRLIAMSTHSHLRSKEKIFSLYQNSLNTMVQTLRKQVPDWRNDRFYPLPNYESRHLIILVGSQKGLCGAFNTTLFKLLETAKPAPTTDYIAVGKKAVDYLNQHTRHPSIESFPVFNQTTLLTIAGRITQLIMQNHHYTSVTIYSNKSKTFFLQKPHKTTIVPLEEPATTVSHSTEDYVWQQSPHELLDTLVWQAIEATIQYLLFQSLLAEHSARFISMDMSTRNAERALDTSKLQYNKLRQSKITKELTELMGSL